MGQTGKEKWSPKGRNLKPAGSKFKVGKAERRVLAKHWELEGLLALMLLKWCLVVGLRTAVQCFPLPFIR